MRFAPASLRLLIGLLCTAFALPALSAVPQTIAVQGALRTSAGGPVTDGDYILSFALYEAAKDGVAVWKEGPEILTVSGGAFTWALGSTKALDAKKIGTMKAVWLGVKVSKEAELPRVPLRSVAFALQAASANNLACSGCVESGHIKADSIAADRLAFPWAGSKTKAGPALSALDLQCTGCVSLKELAIDGDLDLGGNALKAKKVSAGEVSAQTVSATAFLGDGSKLTGIKIPTGSCKNKSDVVHGIAADGSLLCVPGLNAKALPPDAIVQVSNGLLSNRYVDVTLSSKTPLKIPDNNPVGVFDELDVPDLGIAKTLSVRVSLTNSDISGLQVWIFDPTNAQHVLYDKGGKGTKLDGTWPAPDKQIKGDLTAWQGKNAKGKWRLKVVDTKAGKGGDDGAVGVFEIKVETISAKKIDATGDLTVQGDLLAKKGVNFNKGEAKLMRLQNAAAPPAKCEPATRGLVYYDTKASQLKVCNGADYKSFASVDTLGNKDQPAKDCKAILAAGDDVGDGIYWLKHGNSSVKAWCDMKNGGWTLAASWSYGPKKPAQWGKTALGVADPKPGNLHVIPFADILPKPTEVKLVYLPNKQTISYKTSVGATWQFTNGGARIKVSNGWYLVWDTQSVNGADGVCVVNGNYGNGFYCDGNSSQVGGHGLFNQNTQDEFCNCGGHGWKHGTGGCNATVCGAKGHVAVWLR